MERGEREKGGEEWSGEEWRGEGMTREGGEGRGEEQAGGVSRFSSVFSDKPLCSGSSVLPLLSMEAQFMNFPQSKHVSAQPLV